MPNPSSSRPDPALGPRAQHRREVLTQVLVPFLLLAGMLVTLGLTSILRPAGAGQAGTAAWAHLSTIFMISILLAAGLGVLALLVLGIVLLAAAHGRLPGIGQVVRTTVDLAAIRIRSLAIKPSSVLITARSQWAGVRAGLRALRRPTGED